MHDIRFETVLLVFHGYLRLLDTYRTCSLSRPWKASWGMLVMRLWLSRRSCSKDKLWNSRPSRDTMWLLFKSLHISTTLAFIQHSVNENAFFTSCTSQVALSDTRHKPCGVCDSTKPSVSVRSAYINLPSTMIGTSFPKY